MMEKYDNFLFSLKHQPARLVAAGKLTKDSLSLCKLRHKRKYDNKLNKNSHIKYDYRNLITQIQHKAIVNTDTSFYLTYYSYDEAGNRFAKTIYKYTSSSGPPEDSNPGGPVTDDYWDLYSVEIYSRDISGKELAIYKDNVILEYPLYGLDMIGKIKNDELFFYYKDHLGSVRATVNSSGDVVSSQDFDAWGYLLQDRTFDSDSGKFKFTSKERDIESDYDYFGARYYDSRIANWTSVDPLMEKHFDWSPYNYVLRNPLRLIDPDGEQENFGLSLFNFYATNILPEQAYSDWYSNLSVIQQEEFRYNRDELQSGRVESSEIQPSDIIGGILGIKLASKLSLSMVENSFDDALFYHSVHSMERISEIEASTGVKLTDKIIGKTIEKSAVYTGHKSGALTFISEGTFPGGKNLVIGQNPLTKQLTTIYPTKKSVARISRELTKVAETFSKELIKSFQNTSGF